MPGASNAIVVVKPSQARLRGAISCSEALQRRATACSVRLIGNVANAVGETRADMFAQRIDVGCLEFFIRVLNQANAPSAEHDVALPSASDSGQLKKQTPLFDESLMPTQVTSTGQNVTAAINVITLNTRRRKQE
eukprot:TRINITY_DN10557_c0_g1_i2.p3 TRINITY_DN10557_c0_g1~~TRINITY_DN10557_c0_g1_i2.p3  ORF type:complete len:135 (+),score=14.84 TRINITY_DN10557_c0_g1_i2:217-621(+)